MTFSRVLTWRWWPKFYQAQHADAPYRKLVHIGFWLIFWGKNDDR